ncbi:MAG: helix-turn-helix domain-containing protein [Planctomycetota bacterium]|nr:helix-turn-helix domain-containing protein [Planctomycetota bacterium]
MPPLRERNEDVIFLVETFLEQQASARGLEPPKLDESAKKAIRGCSWPGNVRQLLNLAVRLVVEKPGELVTDSDIGVESSASGEGEQLLNQNYDEAKQTLIEEFTVKYFSRLLEDHEGNIAAAAREAGIQRSYLYRLIKRYDIPAGR